ncbi:UNVERIFIED_CONTAM: hypothetical protein FKN15_035638 [Acipenser sinensis]
MQKATITSGVTAQRISKTITFYKNESKAASMLQQNGPKPLLLLLPWLGSRPHAVDKYRVGKMVLLKVEWLLCKGTLHYFSVLKGYTVDNYNVAIDMFWNNSPQTPALFFCCENDPLSDHKEVERLLKSWHLQGINVVEKGWKDSLHAGHLRKHAQEYLAILHQFLQSYTIK